jgi:hypothetical protein
VRIPYFLEKQINKIIKPQIVTLIETFIDDKPKSKFYGKSLTANFLQLVYRNFNNYDNFNFATPPAPFNNIQAYCLNTSNALINQTSALAYQINGALGNDLKGIAVGSNNTAPTPLDYILNTKIANGSGAGQLNYQAQTSSQGTTVVGAVTSFILERIFVNNSAGDVIVREVGILAGVIPGYTLIYRDILPGNETIGTTKSYRVKITFSITT